MTDQPLPGEGRCLHCKTTVKIDGRPGDEQGSVWSHMRVEVVPVLVPGHDPRCQGDCRYCPIPVEDYEPQQVECGPVYPSGSDEPER